MTMTSTTTTNEYNQMLATISQDDQLCTTTDDEYNQMLSTISQVSQLREEALGQYQLALEQENKALTWHKRRFLTCYPKGMAAGQRGTHMRHAVKSAKIASETMRQAFELIPPGCLLRQRYPDQMKWIGTDDAIPDVTELKTANIVELLKWHVAKNLRNNLQILQQCEIKCDEQQQLIDVVTKAIQEDRLKLNQSHVVDEALP